MRNLAPEDVIIETHIDNNKKGIKVTHKPSSITATCTTYNSQVLNRRIALDTLDLKVNILNYDEKQRRHDM